jgi:hypothetical protein
MAKGAPRAEANVALEFSGNTYGFETDKGLAGAWKKVVEAEPPKGKIETASQLRAYLDKKANTIIVNEGKIAAINMFKPWYRMLLKRDPSVAEQGIVVGGEVAGDVRIINNTIDGVIQGIRIGVSHRESKQGKPDLAGSVVICGNRIDVVLPPVGIRERFGVFVGNCNSLIMNDNYAKLTPFYTTKRFRVEGIHVYGHLGQRMIIRHNHLDKFTLPPAIYFNALNHNEFGQPMWVIDENVASVEVAEKCRKKVIMPRNWASK